MQFFTATLAFTAATLVSANTMTFVNQDETTRTVYITPSAGHAEIPSVEIQGNSRATVDFPDSWIGNAYAVSEGSANNAGMLAEVTFQGSGGSTYYDVSAIVDPSDVNGVKMMYPASDEGKAEKSSFSGCQSFPCNDAYYHPDDVQTVSTEETDLIVTLGTSSDVQARDVEPREAHFRHFPRTYVLGKQ